MKSESGAGIDLRLVHPGDGDLQWILHATDIHLLTVSGLQGAVEGHRFPASGWAGDQQQTLRLVQRGERPPAGRMRVRVLPDPAPVNLMQKAQDNLFAIAAGQSGDAKRERSSRKIQRELAILR